MRVRKGLWNAVEYAFHYTCPINKYYTIQYAANQFCKTIYLPCPQYTHLPFIELCITFLFAQVEL